MTTSRPPGRSAAIAASSTRCIARAAADEHRIGRGERDKRLGRAPSTTSSSGTPKRGGVAPDPRGAVGPRFDGDGAHGRVGEQPLDSDGAGAGADVPQQLAPERRQRGQRHRADLALGDLAVMLEQIVGEAGRIGA